MCICRSPDPPTFMTPPGLECIMNTTNNIIHLINIVIHNIMIKHSCEY